MAISVPLLKHFYPIFSYSFAFTPIWIYLLGTPMVEKSIPIPYMRYNHTSIVHYFCRKGGVGENQWPGGAYV